MVRAVMETVGRLARRFGLSRSTLLYYDRIGLLSPRERSAAGYRLYSDADVRRLERIVAFRGVGLPLESIGLLLADSDTDSGTDSDTAESGSVDAALEQRLVAIDREIAGLRRQQDVILRLLERDEGGGRLHGLDKQSWTEILRATGMDEDDMWRWHREFERMAPSAHQEFLESLNIEADEIESIRSRSRSRH